MFPKRSDGLAASTPAWESHLEAGRLVVGRSTVPRWHGSVDQASSHVEVLHHVVRTVAEDLRAPDVLYVGSEFGLFVTVVNLDPHFTQAGWIELPLEEFDLPANRPYQMHDLLTDARYLWHGNRNYVELDPATSPAHIFRIRRRARWLSPSTAVSRAPTTSSVGAITRGSASPARSGRPPRSR